MRGFRDLGAWFRLATSTCIVRARRPLCTTTNNGKDIVKKDGGEFDAYRKLDNLDMKTAAEILFRTPPKKKKFGIDFHLVQLFFACMPSFAVFLVAQYARYEIRRMEAEAELKKKEAEEKEKAKELEEKTLKEKEEAESNPDLFDVKVRLEALEEALKEIAVETKKRTNDNLTKAQEGHKDGNQEPDRLNSERKSKDSSSETNDQPSKKLLPESKSDVGNESIGRSGSKG